MMHKQTAQYLLNRASSLQKLAANLPTPVSIEGLPDINAIRQQLPENPSQNKTKMAAVQGLFAGMPKAAADIYVGEESKLTKDDIQTMLDKFSKNTGAKFDKMPLLSAEHQPFRNFGRYLMPRTLRQIPSRLGHVAGLLGGIAAAPFTFGTSLIPTWGNAFGNVSAGRADMYTPGTGAVHLESGNPFVAAHEVGHWNDLENKRFLTTKGYSDQLRKELAASVFARHALGKKDWKKHQGSGKAALGSYLLGRAEERSGKVLLDDELYDKKWKANLLKAVQGESTTPMFGTPSLQRSVDSAIHTVMRDALEKDDFPDADSTMADWVDEDEKGNIKWMDKTTKGIPTIAGILLDAEYKKKYPNLSPANRRRAVAKAVAVK